MLLLSVQWLVVVVATGNPKPVQLKMSWKTYIEYIILYTMRSIIYEKRKKIIDRLEYIMTEREGI